MCGIIGVYDIERTGEIDLPEIGINLLRGNKNRGQEGYGLSVVTEQDGIKTFKFQDLGSKDLYEGVHDQAKKIIGLIGHARYPTSGGISLGDDFIQPFDIKEGQDHAFAFNGNIANAENIAQEIEKEEGLRFDRPILDTKVLEHMIRKKIQAGETNTKRILEDIHKEIDGSCNIVLADAEGGFTLAKDRWGFRPLFHGTHNGLLHFSSESSALFRVGLHDSAIHKINTGEAVKFSLSSGQLQQSLMDLDKPTDKSRCFFETVYFADPKTKLWGEPSSEHRYRLGQNLAGGDKNTFSQEDTVVLHVPASSKDSADGYAETLNLKHLEAAIFKNPDFDKRSFIAATKEERLDVLKKKYIFHPGLIEKVIGKKVVLIDDSIVRGTTLEYLVQIIQDFFQPSEIHIRIPSPPIMAPCYYAINLKKPEELLANKLFDKPQDPQRNELEKLSEYLGVNSIRYISHDGLIDALQVEVKDMCMGCITGDFPTPKGQEIYTQQLEEIESGTQI